MAECLRVVVCAPAPAETSAAPAVAATAWTPSPWAAHRPAEWAEVASLAQAAAGWQAALAQRPVWPSVLLAEPPPRVPAVPRQVSVRQATVARQTASTCWWRARCSIRVGRHGPDAAAPALSAACRVAGAGVVAAGFRSGVPARTAPWALAAAPPDRPDPVRSQTKTPDAPATNRQSRARASHAHAVVHGYACDRRSRQLSPRVATPSAHAPD